MVDNLKVNHIVLNEKMVENIVDDKVEVAVLENIKVAANLVVLINNIEVKIRY